MRSLSTKKHYIEILISSLVALLFFFLILSIKIPYSFSQFFRSSSLFLFLILIGIYYLSFQLSGWYSLLAGTMLTMVFFAMPLSYLWTSGYSFRAFVGGILPARDGFSIYNSTQLLFTGELLPSWNLFRPSTIGFLSSLLLFTQQNLKWSIAILVGLAGICIYFTGRKVYSSFGAPAASVFLSLLFFYMQQFIGKPHSEWLGITFGCLAFLLLWKASQTLRIKDLTFGLVILTVGISVRAGTFFVFPVLLLWGGWFFTKQRFSFRVAGIAVISILVTFLLINNVYSKLVMESGGSSFGNFAYVVYSQVTGGTELSRARKDLGLEIGWHIPPKKIYQAALDQFIEHPFSIFIGAAKAYRDFFLVLFNFRSPGWVKFLDIVVCSVLFILLFGGVYISARRKTSPFSMLMVTMFIGLFLSIPFLPPSLGGNRFYVSTIPFYFLLIVIPISELFPQSQDYNSNKISLLERAARPISILLVIMTYFVPVLILKISSKPVILVPECPKEQIPFAVKVNPGSYVDVIPEGTASCGLAPKICMNDYFANTVVKYEDIPLFQELAFQVETSDTDTRILIGINLVGDVINAFRFFVGTSDQFQPILSNNIIVGCAVESESHQFLIITTPDSPIETR